MNEGAIDSAQNGLAASVSGHFLKNKPLAYARIAVLLLNIPLIAIGSLNLNVLSLFLTSNLLTCCAAVPVALGLVRRLRGFLTETSFVVGTFSGIIGVSRDHRGIG
jgi:hypothetical protein